VTSEPRAFFTIDAGTATTAVALIGRVDRRWRLLGASSFPAGIDQDAVVALLAARVRAADPEMATEIGLPGDGDDLGSVRRLAVATRPAPRLAIVAATRRARGLLETALVGSGWLILPVSLDRDDGAAITGLLTRRDVETAIVAAGDPAGGDERGSIDQLSELAVAAAGRRPELTMILGGAMAAEAARFAGREPRRIETADAITPPAPGELLLVPAAIHGSPPGATLRRIFGAMRAEPGDGRWAIVGAAAALAAVLDRRVEIVEIGHDGGIRAVAAALGGGAGRVEVHAGVVAAAALVPPVVDDALVDAVLGWSTLTIDRHRLRDRLRDLRMVPWADAQGDGALIRLAAARAALARLVAATPDIGTARAPDVVIAAGGAFAVAPGPAIALAMADVLRRPGASQFAYDHARLLGPLGAIEDPIERRTVVADLADDLLAPLGSVVLASGLRLGRSAGRLVVHAQTGASEVELIAGGLELVDLPPGETAIAEFQFRDTVMLGTRGRHFAVDVGGGLGGLLVDLRDVPLKLPERLDRRREQLDAWQRSLWIGLDG
jgi:hypothetical protein